MQKPHLLFILAVICCLGCSETETPITETPVEVKVQVSQPVAKLIRATPKEGSTLQSGDQITLEFTEVPENFMFRCYKIDRHGRIISKRFSDTNIFFDDTKAETVYNGTKKVRFKVPRLIGSGSIPVRIYIVWTHGRVILDYNIGT